MITSHWSTRGFLRKVGEHGASSSSDGVSETGKATALSHLSRNSDAISCESRLARGIDFAGLLVLRGRAAVPLLVMSDLLWQPLSGVDNA